MRIPSCGRSHLLLRIDVSDHGRESEEGRPEKPRLSHAAGEERSLSADLDRMMTEKLMMQADAGLAEGKNLDYSAGLSLPTFDELETIVSQGMAKTDSAPSADVIDPDTLGKLTVNGIRLHELLDRGGTSQEERAVLKSGLLFLSRRMYREAAEWWMLSLPKDHIANARFHCLLTLLLALTYEWSGDAERAQAAKEQAMQTMKFVK
jgi:hypothetical protein